MSDLYPPATPAVPDFKMEVALGRIPGFEQDFLIGVNPVLQDSVEEMLWDQGGLRSDIPAPSNVFVSSSSASDTGGPSVIIVGLDENFNRTILSATLNGQNQVQATNVAGGSDLMVWVQAARMLVATPAGDVYVALTSALTAGVPNDLTAIQSKIIQGNNITRNGEYMVPAGMNAVNVAQRGGTDSTDKIMAVTSVVTLFGEPPARTVTYSVLPDVTQYTFPIPVGSSSVLGQNVAVFPEKTKISILAIVSVGNTAGFFGVDLMLVENRFIGN